MKCIHLDLIQDEDSPKAEPNKNPSTTSNSQVEEYGLVYDP